MEQDEVLAILGALKAREMRLWVAGGWGVDALVGRQTREHRDLDLLVDVERLEECLNLAQAVGFASRRNHGMVVNNSLGVVIAVLAAPASAALVGYARAGSPWWLGPAVFDRFDALATVVALDVGRAAVDVVERADIAMSGVR